MVVFVVDVQEFFLLLWWGLLWFLDDFTVLYYYFFCILYIITYIMYVAYRSWIVFVSVKNGSLWSYGPRDIRSAVCMCERVGGKKSIYKVSLNLTNVCPIFFFVVFYQFSNKMEIRIMDKLSTILQIIHCKERLKILETIIIRKKHPALNIFYYKRWHLKMCIR